MPLPSQWPSRNRLCIPAPGRSAAGAGAAERVHDSPPARYVRCRASGRCRSPLERCSLPCHPSSSWLTWQLPMRPSFQPVCRRVSRRPGLASPRSRCPGLGVPLGPVLPVPVATAFPGTPGVEGLADAGQRLHTGVHSRRVLPSGVLCWCTPVVHTAPRIHLCTTCHRSREHGHPPCTGAWDSRSSGTVWAPRRVA